MQHIQLHSRYSILLARHLTFLMVMVGRPGLHLCFFFPLQPRCVFLQISSGMFAALVASEQSAVLWCKQSGCVFAVPGRMNAVCTQQITGQKLSPPACLAREQLIMLLKQK